MKRKYLFILLFTLSSILQSTICSDITPSAFGSLTNIMPAAFGDFNADELTDLFVIKRDINAIEILLSSIKEPFFSTGPELQCRLDASYHISSIVPGDFDGDALMDVLVTANKPQDRLTYIFIHWGRLSNLSCSTEPLMKMIDEPLAIVYNQSLKTDLFGVDENGTLNLWLVSKNRIKNGYQKIPLPNPKNLTMRIPHSHAFTDVNDDNWPDLFLTCEEGYHVWLYDNQHGFVYGNQPIPYPTKVVDNVGQNLFMDLETADNIYPIVPVCLDGEVGSCHRSAIYAYANNDWVDLRVNFQEKRSEGNKTWGFVPRDGHAYTDTITLRAGDFNNDGYVDLLATLTDTPYSNKLPNSIRTFLLDNVPCTDPRCVLTRTFEIRWNALSPDNDWAIMGTFYDFMQDGILDVIFVHRNPTLKVSAFKNSLDYDANFIKVMVISGLKNKDNESPDTILGPKRTFGTNLPGPRVQYKTTTQDGNDQAGVASQLPQSAHFAMYLPYTIFGLGRTPNFVEDLTVGCFNGTKTFTQIIPNSQLVVIPYPPNNPLRWRAQLFVTPSKVIWQTAIALIGTCVVIGFIICLLHWKERREDRIEKLQEAQRFHFDAM